MAGAVFVTTRAIAFVLAIFPLPATGNWLLQCSSCLDQALYSDAKIKNNVEDADLQTILQQIKHIKIREFDHGEDEFFNKFFSKRQLGIMAHELQPVMPTAVGILPERRWTNPKGVTNQTKNVMLIRDTHLLFAALGAVQLLAKKADIWDESIEKLFKENSDIVAEQEDNRHKREDMLNQIVRAVAKVEVMQHGFAKTEETVARMDGYINSFKEMQEERHNDVLGRIYKLDNKSLEQDAVIAKFMDDFREAVDREARADLVEKRRKAQADLEVQLVKRSIEKMRWEEEQKTIELKNEEQRKSDDHSTQKHHERVAYETAQKKAADLELMTSQEESNLRQQAQKHKDERELLELRLKSDERRAEMGVQEAIEKAKIEEEGKIKAARENEDVNTRLLQAEQAEKRVATLAAIQATAEIAADWIRIVFTSTYNLGLLIGSIVACLGGIYLVREMAILLREQLNKRLGRPSLVRMTNRRGTFQQIGIALLRLLRLRPPHGERVACARRAPGCTFCRRLHVTPVAFFVTCLFSLPLLLAPCLALQPAERCTSPLPRLRCLQLPSGTPRRLGSGPPRGRWRKRRWPHPSQRAERVEPWISVTSSEGTPDSWCSPSMFCVSTRARRPCRWRSATTWCAAVGSHLRLANPSMNSRLTSRKGTGFSWKSSALATHSGSLSMRARWVGVADSISGRMLVQMPAPPR